MNLHSALRVVLSLLVFIVVGINSANGSHSAGGSISYVHLGGNQYRFNMKFYRYCSGVSEPNSFDLCIKNLCNNFSTSITLTKLSGNLPNGKPNGSVTVDDCTGAPANCLTGYREWWYTGVYTLPSVSSTCDEWNFSIGYCCRNASDNLVNGSNNYFYIDASLKRKNTNSSVTINNNSADFPLAPYPYYCINQQNFLNNQVYDADGDSLVYYSTNPKRVPNNSCPLVPNNIPFSNTTFNILNNPFPSDTNGAALPPGGTYKLDSSSGSISFIPTQVGIYTVSMRVDEYRNGQFIGHVIRDVQIQVIANCTQLPNIKIDTMSVLNSTITDSGIHICAGQNASYCYYAIGGNDTSHISLFSNVNLIIPTATIMQSNVSVTGNDSIKFCLNWQPTINDTGVYYLLLIVQDSICNPPIYIYNQTYTLPIYVHPPPIINTTIIPANCMLPNGQINASNSIGVDTFILNPGHIISTTGLYNNLANGTYTITGKNKFCSSSDTVQLVAPNPLTITSILSNTPTCLQPNLGTLQLSTINGIGTITYSINPLVGTNNNNGSFTNLSAGTYLIHVVDSVGCADDTLINILAPPAPVISNVMIQPVSCFGYNNGMIQINASSAALPITYTLLPNNVSNTAGIFSNLMPGNYSVLLTDNNGCDTSFAFSITQPPQIQLFISDTIAPSCNPSNNGQAVANYTGGIGSATLWVNGVLQINDTLKNLSAGFYMISVQDSNGCTDSVGLNLTAPLGPLINNATVSNLLCNDDSSGSIIINATGTNLPLQYTLLPANSSNLTGQFSNLPAANYSVAVTDSKNCIAVTALQINQPSVLTAPPATVTNCICNGHSNGQIQITAQGGTPSFSYQLLPTNNTNSTGAFSSLPAGYYNVIITDQNNCQYQDSVLITEPPLLNIDSLQLTHILCNGNYSGAAVYSGTGGTSPYSFQLLPNLITQSSGNFSNLNAGNYKIILNDNKGCSDSSTFILQEPAALQSTYNTTAVSCNGFNNGALQVNTVGGIQPYIFNLLGSTNTNSTGLFNSLSTQSYSVIVKDSVGCSDTISPILITEPPVLQTTVSTVNNKCFGDTTGSILAISTGGNGGYTYQLIPNNVFNNTGIFNNLISGTYSIIIADTLLCSDTISAALASNPQLFFDSISVTHPKCFGDSNGKIRIFVQGGKPAYSYAIGNAIYTTNNSLSNLRDNTYTIFIKDSEGCKLDTAVSILNPPILTFQTIFNPMDSCFKVDNAEVQIIASGGSGLLSYLSVYNNVQNYTGYFTDLDYNKNYQFIIKDLNNCQLDTTLSLDRPSDTLKVDFDVSHLNCEGALTGDIEAVVTNGTAPYTYFWPQFPLVTSAYINDLRHGIYHLKVTDAKGCSLEDTVVVNPGPCCKIFVPNAFTPNNDGLNDDFGFVTPAGLHIAYFKIFNRWGQCVWESTNQYSRWDGTLKNEACDMGTFFYIIKFVCDYDGKSYSERGDVTLIR